MDELKHELSFFRILRDNKNLIESYDIDSQFELIVDYINYVIIEAINDIIPEQYQGVQNNENYLLANNIDGSISWKPLNNLIKNYSIDLKKIKKPYSKGNILYIDTNQNLALTESAITDNMILSIKSSIPFFKLIEENNIEDEAIIADDIADKTIEKENLSQELIDILNGDVLQDIKESYLGNDNFNNFSITSNLIKNNTFNNVEKFGVIDNKFLFVPMSGDGTYNDLQWDLIADGAITNDLINQNNPKSSLEIYFDDIKCVIKNKFIKDAINTIDIANKCFKNFPFSELINFNKLSPDFKITRKHFGYSYMNAQYAVNCVDKYSFDKEVQDAFTRKGC